MAAENRLKQLFSKNTGQMCIRDRVLAYIYRRYRGGSAMGSILGSLRPAVVALIAGAGLSMLLAAVLPAVSYTHLDVYKRQANKSAGWMPWH